MFPGIALGRALVERGDVEVLFVGSARGLEARAVPAAGFRLVTIGARQVRGGGVARALRGGAALLLGVTSALRALLRFRPDVVVGVGGYASVPTVLSAAILRKPVLLLEQNVVPGATNRMLGRLARCVCTSFPETAVSFPGVRVVCTGNPVRPEVLGIAEARASASAVGPTTLLVIGGSAGAHRLNVGLGDALACSGRSVDGLRVVHQTGEADADATRARYAALGVEAEVRPFFDDMAPVYHTADFAVCRAGATTIAELLVVGIPAVLVPYPFAADDHQRRNAEAVAAAGAGVIVLERDLTAERLRAEIDGMLGDPARRRRMAAAARTLARPDAARAVAAECALLAGGRP